MSTLDSRAGVHARMRLVMIYGSVKPRFCGVEAASVTMHSALEECGMSVEVVNLDDWGAARTRDLTRRVSELRPDAIFIAYPTLAFDRKLGPVLFALLQRIAPLMVVVHEFNHVHVLRRLAISVLAARAAQVVVTTETEKAGLLRWNPWLRRRVKVNPIPATIPSREWAPSPELEVTTVSLLRPDKGLESFLACCEELSAARPDLTFRIIGSEVPRFPEYADKIRRMAAERGVTISENLTDDAVADTLSKATIALLPFPDGATDRRSSLVAAAVCGVPIVTTMGRNTPADLARILAPVHDQAGLVQRTLECCGSLEARAAAHEQSMKIAEKFSAGVVIGNLVGYLMALSRSGAGGPSGRTAGEQV